MDLTKRAAIGVSLVVFLIAAAVYFITLTPTVPFWDSGEFIAVSYILGIPHPPGTPFYVMLGRIATLIPIATIAQRVNGLSALASALAVWVSFLTMLKLIRLAQGRGPSGRGAERSVAVALDEDQKVSPPSVRSDEWIAIVGAASGALLLAFSDNFWENSIEAEVYSMMSLAQILVFWLGLRWWEAHEKRPTVGPLLVGVYVMWLCVGLHLGVGMMGLPLLVLVWLVDRKVAQLFFMPLLSVLLLTWGFERTAGGVLGLTTLYFLIQAFRGQLNGWIMAGAALASGYGMLVAFSDDSFVVRSATIALAGLVVPLVLLMRRGREGRILGLALLLMVVGYSTHVYLPIRAAQHPAINEGAPATWERLRDLLERKQYGETNMFVRRSALANQLGKEFWRYFARQWPLVPSTRLWGALLPLALGLAGAWWQWRRERISFLSTACLFLFGTAGMIAFLNFTDHEVRDRDYFFTTGYHAYALWIGMGAAWVMTWVRDSFAAGRMQLAGTVACAALMLGQPVLLMRNLWFAHDRRGNYVAHDYAYNMLAPLAKDAFMFTNGDNDTFPLWYLQQVEGVRKDVRVVNLSLLNTDWYIRQLRDEDPKVPIQLDDESVDRLGVGLLRDPETGEYIYTSHYMVAHIMDQDRAPGGWKKPPYFAVTVPEHMGLDKNFTLEGLVYRVNPDTTGPRFDEAATRRALYDVFKYRGLFTADGSWDSVVYKDENAATLSRNYAGAYMELAYAYRRAGRLPQAVAEMERVERMFPGSADVLLPLGSFYVEAGDTAKAIRLFTNLARAVPGDPDVRYYYGVSLLFQQRLDEALHEFEAAIKLDPEHAQSYVAAYSVMWESGQHERALQFLEQWTSRHPNDPQARALLEGRRRELGLKSERPTVPPPTLPNLP